MTEEKKSITCKCGHFSEFPAYVYAHWYHQLVWRCPECGTRYDLLAGVYKEDEYED